MSDDHTSSIVPADVAISEVAAQDKPAAVVDFAEVLHAIINKDISPEMLREVLTIQRDFNNEADDKIAKREFTVALIGLKKDLPPVIAHDKKVNFKQTRFNYASLAQLVSVVTPIMCRHGFTHKWIPSYDGDRKVGITCELEHVGGHVVTAFLPSTPSDKQGMSNAQAVTATQTTLKRSTLLSLLGLATADMDDAPQQSQSEPSGVDGNRNIEAAVDIRSRGLDVADAEKLVGCRMPQWTNAHLSTIWKWVKEQAKKQEASEPKDPFDAAPDTETNKE